MSLRNVNTVTLSGNTVAEPRITEHDDAKFAFLTIAANRRAHKDANGQWQQKADFIPLSVYGSAVDRLKNLPKGSTITVQGSIESYNYTKDDGTKVYGVRVHVNDLISVVPLEKKAQRSAAEPVQDESAESESFDHTLPDITPDDLPF